MPPGKARRKLRDGFEGPWKGPGGCLTHRPGGPVINRRLHQRSGRPTELCAGLSMRNPRSDFDLPVSTIQLEPPSAPWKQGTNEGDEESGPEGPEHTVRANPAERRPQAPLPVSTLLSFNSLYCGPGSLKKPLPDHPNPLRGKGLYQVSEYAATHSKSLRQTFWGPPEALQPPSREQLPKDPGAGFRAGWSG